MRFNNRAFHTNHNHTNNKLKPLKHLLNSCLSTIVSSLLDFLGQMLLLTLIRLGFFKVVFSGGINLMPFIFQEELI